MRTFHLAEDFIDMAAERGLLAALLADSELRVRLEGKLTPELFPTEIESAQRILNGQPCEQALAWPAAADPAASLELVRDLYKRRQLAQLQENLGELLYNPARPVEDAASLVDAWRKDSVFPASLQKAAKPVPASAELLDRVLSDVTKRAADRKQTGCSINGIPTGLPKVDGLLNGLCPGLHVLGGAPGAGKTTLALQIAVHAASTGKPVLYLTFENTASNLVLKALCANADLAALDAERGFANLSVLAESSEELRPALERLAIVEGTLRSTVASIRETASEWFGGQRGLIVVDYLQRAAHQHGYEQVRQNVSRLAAELRELASALDSPVLALASQNRSAGDYGRGGGSAQLDSLKESGDLEYAADSVMFLRTDKSRTLSEPVRAIELAVVKNRFGPLGAIPLVYRADIGYLREDSKEPIYSLQWVSNDK